MASLIKSKRKPLKRPDYYTLYSITCLSNNRMYIGVCTWYDQRKGKHLYDLRRNKSGNINLQIDFNFYGEGNFVFDIIERYKDKNEALIIEKYYTDCIFCMDENICYNIIRGGDDVIPQIQKRFQDKIKSNPEFAKKIAERCREINTGKKLSDSTKEKIRQSHIGIKASPELKKKFSEMRKGALGSKAKKVIDNNTGKVYGCLKDATSELGFRYDTIRARINGYNKQKTYLQWLL